MCYYVLLILPLHVYERRSTTILWLTVVLQSPLRRMHSRLLQTTPLHRTPHTLQIKSNQIFHSPHNMKEGRLRLWKMSVQVFSIKSYLRGDQWGRYDVHVLYTWYIYICKYEYYCYLWRARRGAMPFNATRVSSRFPGEAGRSVSRRAWPGVTCPATSITNVSFLRTGSTLWWILNLEYNDKIPGYMSSLLAMLCVH